MNALIKSRLGCMMFLNYFIWGAWYVTLGTWLATALRFSGQQIGWIAGTTAIGAMISPFFAGLVADRSLATQKVLGILHGCGALLLWVGSGQTSFLSLYIAVLVYSICYMPTLALTNALAFRQMQDPRQEFGVIRVFGTIGWIVAGLMVGTLGLEATAVPMRIAAAASVLMALYSFTLPDTPPLATQTPFRLAHIIPTESLQLFRNRSFAVFALVSFLICIPLQFYYAFANLFLNEIGIPNAAGKMTGGQMSELFCMLLLPWFFRRLGVKYTLALGMFAWVARYLCFAYGDGHGLMWMLWGGIVLHGICYDFFFVVGQIYVDRAAPVALRAATQGVITFLTYGVGMFVGSGASGWIVDRFAQTGPVTIVNHDWRSIWISAAVFSAAVLMVFLAFFTEQKGVSLSENTVEKQRAARAAL
ncbi:MAG: nucleoside permease [Steroidobacteraceae bacterium]